MQSTMTPAPAPVHAGNMPDPEVPERAKRRSFSAKEKLRILSEVDKAPAGQIAAILRREGIYSSQLATWRKQRKDGSIAGLSAKRGRGLTRWRQRTRSSAERTHACARISRTLAS